ncbi:hypothetical protein [Paraburkholderia lacunae]|uniref:Uncharacterized protein n=1 Tax=Paraburkholderia lacunae TaxID=2211104 RepID=A0A370N5T3_9BURK|nr:hypothetical protein [Paraburkholderia lacunae]RDK00966.1 hypothetical protein DLM46_19265 [Paraburkholderia lacunae]
MSAEHETKPAASTVEGPQNHRRLSIATRNVLMIAVGLIVFVIVSTIVLYQTIAYGDAVPNFGIILMMTVPVIAGVAFRVGLDAWLDKG